MNTLPIAGPKRRFAIMSLASVATIIVIAGALALTFAPSLVKAQSGSAFVRVNFRGQESPGLRQGKEWPLYRDIHS